MITAEEKKHNFRITYSRPQTVRVNADSLAEAIEAVKKYDPSINYIIATELVTEDENEGA